MCLRFRSRAVWVHESSRGTRVMQFDEVIRMPLNWWVHSFIFPHAVFLYFISFQFFIFFQTRAQRLGKMQSDSKNSDFWGSRVDRCKISDVRPVLRMRLSHYNWLCLHVGWECTYSHQRCVHDTFAVAELEASHWGDQGEIITDIGMAISRYLKCLHDCFYVILNVTVDCKL